MNPSNSAPSLYGFRRVHVSKIADTDLSLGLDVAYIPFDGEPSTTSRTNSNGIKALTVTSVKPGSIVEQMVKAGDIICLASALHPPSSHIQPPTLHKYILPSVDEFRREVNKSRPCSSFSFHVACKKQTSHIASGAIVEHAFQEPSDAMGIVPESAIGSQHEENTTASSSTISRKRARTSEDDLPLLRFVKHNQRTRARTRGILELMPMSTSAGQDITTESGQQHDTTESGQQQDNDAIETQGVSPTRGQLTEPLASTGSGSPCVQPDLAEWSRLDRAMRSTSPNLLKAPATNSGKHKDNDAVEMRGASPARVRPVNPCAPTREIAESSNLPLVKEPTGTVRARKVKRRMGSLRLGSVESTRQSKERAEQGDSTPRQPCTNANTASRSATQDQRTAPATLTHTSSAPTVSPNHNRAKGLHSDGSGLGHAYQNLINLVFPDHEKARLECLELHREIAALDLQHEKLADSMHTYYQAFSLGYRGETETSTTKSAAAKLHELQPRLKIPPLVMGDKQCWTKIGAAVDSARNETKILQARKLDLQHEIDRRQAALTSLKSEIEAWKADCRSALVAIRGKANGAVQK
jgi:hypothetical protein